MNREELITYAMWTARCEILRHASTESCILTAKLLSEVYRREGIASMPLTVGVIATNEVAHAKFLAGENPQPGEDGAYAIGIRYIEGGGESDEFWSAHVGLLIRRPEGGGLFIDPSCDQMTRPELGITVQPQVLGFDTDEALDRFLDGEAAVIDNPHGGGVQYEAHPNEVTYVNAPDWTESVEGEPLYEQVMNTVLGLLDVYRDVPGLPPMPPLPIGFRTGDQSPESLAHAMRSLIELGYTEEMVKSRHERHEQKQTAKRAIDATDAVTGLFS